MKQFFSVSAAIVLLLTIVSCTKEKFHVEGTITDATDSVLYFENMSLDGPVTVDSVKLDAKGAFEFSGERPDAPDFYRLRISNGIINISIDSTETVKVQASYPTMSSQYEVTGSENCQKIKELSLLQQKLQGQVISLMNNTSIGEEQTEQSINQLVEQYKDYVRRTYIFKEPHKAYAYFALFQSLGDRLIFNPRTNDMDIKTFGAVATGWDSYYPNTLRGENLHNITIQGMNDIRALKARSQGIDPSKVSEINVIDIPLTDNHGKRRSLTELKGKVVLLDFHVFASDKSPQRIMLLRELYNKYHSQGFEIYQVSLDSDEHFWKTQTAALPWINVNDPSGPESQYLIKYNVGEIPTFFLIDRTNTLHKRDSQIKDLDAEIKGLLAR